MFNTLFKDHFYKDIEVRKTTEQALVLALYVPKNTLM